MEMVYIDKSTIWTNFSSFFCLLPLKRKFIYQLFCFKDMILSVPFHQFTCTAKIVYIDIENKGDICFMSV